MSLLTEEQIKQLVEMATVPIYLHDKICEWNEKQPSTQFEPDWNTAPEKAAQAVVNSFWVDANGDTFGVYKTYYDRPKPVITPHPHAEIMAKYAEVAARRVDPWVEFQMRRNTIPDDRWIKVSGSTPHPRWEENMEYRHIGDEK